MIDTNAIYTALPPHGQKIWRKHMFLYLESQWMKAQVEYDYEQNLFHYMLFRLVELEYDERYEICAGIRDMMDEYSERLRR